MVTVTFLMVRIWVTSRVFSVTWPMVSDDLDEVADVEGAGVGEQDAGDDVGDRRTGAEGEEDSEKDGDAFEGRGLGAGQVGEGNDYGEGDDEELDDLKGGHGPLGIEAMPGDGATLEFAKEDTRDAEGDIGEEDDDKDDEEAGAGSGRRPSIRPDGREDVAEENAAVGCASRGRS